MIGYVKCFDSNEVMFFKAIVNKLLKKYTQVLKKVKHLLNIKSDSETVYGDNDKYIKRKIKLCRDKVNTNFQSKKIPKENTAYKCLSLIILDSAIKVNKKHYPQTLLKDCKYEIKKTKMENLITDELEPSSFDDGKESDNESNNESCNETESDNESKKSNNNSDTESNE